MWPNVVQMSFQNAVYLLNVQTIFFACYDLIKINTRLHTQTSPSDQIKHVCTFTWNPDSIRNNKKVTLTAMSCCASTAVCCNDRFSWLCKVPLEWNLSQQGSQNSEKRNRYCDIANMLVKVVYFIFKNCFKIIVWNFWPPSVFVGLGTTGLKTRA